MYRLKTTIMIVFVAATLTAANDPLLNRTTAYDQKDVSLAASTKSYVAVWNSYNQDSSSGGIFGLVLDLDHPIAATEFQVNEISEGNQSQPDVCVMPDGSFAVCWRGPWQAIDSENIILRLFDSNAAPLTDDILVNRFTDGFQRLPRIAALTSGRYVVAWESESYVNREKKAVCCRVFDANGLPITDEFLATDQAYAARNVDIAATGPDQFMVVWLNDRTSDSVWARSFNAQGQAVLDSFQVNESPFKTLTCPSLSANGSGQYAVAWDGDPNAGAEDDVHVRFFDANHVPLSPDYRLNASTGGAQQNPTISIDDKLCAVVAWESDHLSEDQGLEIIARYIDVNGLACGPENSMSNDHIGDQANPCVVMTSKATFILAWESSKPENSSTDIYYCWGRCPSLSDMNADSHTDFIDFTLLAQLWNQDSLGHSILMTTSETDLGFFCSDWLTRSIAPFEE